MTQVLLNIYDLVPQNGPAATTSSLPPSSSAGNVASLSSLSSLSSSWNSSAAAGSGSAAESDGGLSSMLRALGGLTHALGLGAYHTGVEVYGVEYAFGGHEEKGLTGIYECAPRMSMTGVFRESCSLGTTQLSRSDVVRLMDELRRSPEFDGTRYHVLHWNCNHFSHAFAEKLGSQAPPPHVNRLASLGALGASVASWFSPQQQPQQQQQQQQQQQSQMSTGGVAKTPGAGGSFQAFSGSGYTLGTETTQGTGVSLAAETPDRSKPASGDSDAARRRALMAEAALRRLDQSGAL